MSRLAAWLVALVLAGCSATSESSGDLASTPGATPAVTSDGESGYRAAMCDMLVASLDLSPQFARFSEATYNQDQAALKAAYDDLHGTLVEMRVAATDAPHWERGEEAKVAIIRVTNDLDSAIKRMVNAQNWNEAFEEVDAVNDVAGRMTDALAQMDALGFDRGGNC
jgi:hypothetical protein